MITKDIEKVKSALINEEIVAIPIETVYGLAGNIYSEIAMKKIFKAKKRPFFNPLIVHIKSVEYLENIAQNIPEIAWKLATTFWPGPLTLVLDKKENISDLITAGKDTVAVRVPNHDLTLELLNAIEFPIAAPSANIFKTLSPTSSAHVYKSFGDEILILEGNNCKLGIESTIIGFEKNLPIVYRFGAISLEEIESITGKIKIASNQNSKPDAPGMLSQHYSPKTDLILTTDLQSEILKFNDKKIGVLQFGYEVNENQVFKTETLSANEDLKEAASNFYNALHTLDLYDLDLIIAKKMPNEGLGKTINDRLTRAISK